MMTNIYKKNVRQSVKTFSRIAGSHLTHKGRAAITSAGIFANLSAGANLARVKLEPVACALPLIVKSYLQVGVAPEN